MSFSALQRAENSSIGVLVNLARQYGFEFQCSSASRKFLNAVEFGARFFFSIGFSALQRAENSSMPDQRAVCAEIYCVSVLFSEPKIPQLL